MIRRAASKRHCMEVLPVEVERKSKVWLLESRKLGVEYASCDQFFSGDWLLRVGGWELAGATEATVGVEQLSRTAK